MFHSIFSFWLIVFLSLAQFSDYDSFIPLITYSPHSQRVITEKVWSLYVSLSLKNDLFVIKIS